VLSQMGLTLQGGDAATAAASEHRPTERRAKTKVAPKRKRRR